MLAVSCNSSALASTLVIVKRVMLLIQIVVPILLIVFGAIGFFQMAMNPERKNGLKNILNKFLAAAIVFMVPVFVNAVMGMVGESTNFSSCWNNAPEKTSSSSSYISPDNHKRSPVIPNSGDYENGK